jgi:hypothetical protein
MDGEQGKPTRATFEPGREEEIQKRFKEALKSTIDGMTLTKIESVRHSIEYYEDGFPEQIPTKNITITIEGREK